MSAEIASWWPAGLFGLQVVMAWALWSMRHAFASRDDLDAIRSELASDTADVTERIEEQERALAVVREAMKALPSHREFADLREEVAAVAGDIKELRSDVRGTREAQQAQLVAVNRIQDWLIQRVGGPST